MKHTAGGNVCLTPCRSHPLRLCTGHCYQSSPMPSSQTSVSPCLLGGPLFGAVLNGNPRENNHLFFWAGGSPAKKARPHKGACFGQNSRRESRTFVRRQRTEQLRYRLLPGTTMSHCLRPIGWCQAWQEKGHQVCAGVG